MRFKISALALLLCSASVQAEGWKIDRCSPDDLANALKTLKSGQILFSAKEEASIRNLGRKLLALDGKNGGLYTLTGTLTDRRLMDFVNDRELNRLWKETMSTRMASLFITRPSNRTGETKGKNRGVLPELTQRIANTKIAADWCAAFLSFVTYLTECGMQESLGELLSPFTDKRFAEIDAKLRLAGIPEAMRDTLLVKKGVLTMNVQALSDPAVSQGLASGQSWFFDAINNAHVGTIVSEARQKGLLVKEPEGCRAGMMMAWVDGRTGFGHIGLIREAAPQKNGGVILRTVEANTSASGSDDAEKVGGSRYGVYPKKYGPKGFNLPGTKKVFRGCVEIF